MVHSNIGNLFYLLLFHWLNLVVSLFLVNACDKAHSLGDLFVLSPCVTLNFQLRRLSYHFVNVFLLVKQSYIQNFDGDVIRFCGES